MNKVQIINNHYVIPVNDHLRYPLFAGDVLVSIKPQFASLILDGSKTYELRKRMPSFKPGTRLLIYESSPVQRITGMVTYVGCLCSAPWRIWNRLYSHLGIEFKSFMKYYEDSRYAYAWELIDPISFQSPITLQDIGITRPPQSYQFIPTPNK